MKRKIRLLDVLRCGWIEFVSNQAIDFSKRLGAQIALNYLAMQYQAYESTEQVEIVDILIPEEALLKGSAAQKVYQAIAGRISTRAENRAMVHKVCEFCENPFSRPSMGAFRDTQLKYCSSKCRFDAHNEKHGVTKSKKIPSPPIAREVIEKVCAYALCGKTYSFESMGPAKDLAKKYCCSRCGVLARKYSKQEPLTLPAFADPRLNTIASAIIFTQQYTQSEMDSYFSGVRETAVRLEEAIGESAANFYIDEQVKHWQKIVDEIRLSSEEDDDREPRPYKRGDGVGLPTGGSSSICGSKAIKSVMPEILTPFTPPMSIHDIQFKLMSRRVQDSRFRSPKPETVGRVLRSGWLNGKYKRFQNPLKGNNFIYCHAAFYPNPLPGDRVRELVGGTRGQIGTVIAYTEHKATGKPCPIVEFDPSDQKRPWLKVTRMVNPELCYIVSRPESTQNIKEQQRELQAG